jgi:hypothetical protein
MDEYSNHPQSQDQEPTPAEERAVLMNRFGRRLSGVMWSPGAAVSFVAYDKVLEGRLRGKSHMEPIWRANGWDEHAPVTRHEARLRRDALRELGLTDSQLALFDDPWQMLEHQQDLFGYVVGRPITATPANACPAEVDVAWLRRVIPEEGETNRSRWPTDPTWAVVQAASFTEAPVEARHLIRREVRSSRVEKRDVASYGLLVSRTAIAFADPKHWNLDYAMAQLYRTFETESQKPGKVFHELVRHRRRELGLPVPPEERVLPFRMRPSGSLPALDLLIDHDGEEPNAAVHPHTLALLRTERRLEELDIQLGQVDSNTEGVNRNRREELVQAFEQESQVYGAILRRLEDGKERAE